MKRTQSRTKKEGQSRFLRSVNLEHDCNLQDATTGYVLTSTGCNVLRRIAPSIQDKSTTRAWSLTGPYGTGKSAFAVFMSNLLMSSNSIQARNAKKLLKETDGDLLKQLAPGTRTKNNGLMPIAVTSTHESIQNAVLRGLERTVKASLNGSGRKIERAIKDAQAEHKKGKSISSSRVIELLDDASGRICSQKGGPNGTFLILDELGRLLEYANHRPEDSDLAILQDLAEYASRSDRPFLFMTILHQSFGAYASKLSIERRTEWQKIQGRFEDLAFEESSDEILRLISRAMQSNVKYSISQKETRDFTKLLTRAWELGVAPGSMDKKEFLEVLKKCYPLHPLVALTLGTVFRRFGQNERSAFSFLNSHEPYGLQDFLSNGNSQNAKLYCIDQLYDYLDQSLREGIYSSPLAKKWSELEAILSNAHKASAPEINLIKVIGFINAIGIDGSINATPEIIKYATEKASKTQIPENSIKNLIKKSIVVERRYNNTLALWEGSDVDIEAEIIEAQENFNDELSLAEIASDYFPLRPIVAKRHSFISGTLRYFPIQFLSPKSLSLEDKHSFPTLSIELVPTDNQAEYNQVIRKLKESHSKSLKGNIFCVFNGGGEFRTNLRSLASLEWIQKNVKTLEGDSAARKEIDIRIQAIHQILDSQIELLIYPDANSPVTSRWIQNGKVIRFSKNKRLQNILSETCDDIFHKTPHIQNELLNRRKISSAAAAARRNLIQNMFQNSSIPNLGMEGNPPEKSMYLSLLHQSGIHTSKNGNWEFQKPVSNDVTKLSPTWKAILDFFKETESGAKTVADLFDKLSAPPYGIVEGPLPVILCAALLVHDHEVALYKDGTFIPNPGTPDFELLMKHPERYTIQRWRISGVRSSVFQKLAMLIGRELPDQTSGKSAILQLVKPLLHFYRNLNDYALFTQSVSETASNIRRVLEKANEPDSLLFIDLPKACGLAPFSVNKRSTSKRVDQFIEILQGGLRELQGAYERLLNDILSILSSSFGIDSDISEIRAQLTKRGTPLLDKCGDPTLKNFLTRVLQTELADQEWLEATAGVVVVKLPAVWRDNDLSRFQQEMLSISRRFKHFESLILKIPKQGIKKDTELVRIGITTSDAGDYEQVIQLNKQQTKRVDQLEKTLENVLKNKKYTDTNDLVLAALARIAKQRLT
ncbi:hypothetical protein Pan241w_26360 [Gimesia alba]|uniref:ATP-binding protein n=1 Tax=Gimesia alba TaxID=2527973 RepID=A0A517RF95_9PLAN|nr:hypothetical protein [Gimesia alba]QDT42551.1 hypothetical protein Pan241w_26360 [Gimesia alba]